MEICSDAYGSWTNTSIGGAGDRFNPVPVELDVEAPTFATGLFADGCVDVVELLKLLAHYDSAGVGCP